jgi:hypothetical protein
MTLTPINEFDIVFISYDEPNADENWYDLLDKCPWAVRSHGVKGSDAAHKAAARLCSTNRIITVDADNRVNPEFFNLEIDLNRIGSDDVISWAAKNEINGLVYGNGGIKCWPRHVIEAMRTHEAAPQNDKRAQVDFCWNINYVQMNNVYSHVYNNASPLQAWRAGFREGVKMTLDNGDVVDRASVKKLHRKNYQRLLVWQTVGMDVQNGEWAIFGARQGAYMTNCIRDSWDWRNVRDFEWLNNFWHTEVAPGFLNAYGEGDRMCERTGQVWDTLELHSAIVNLGDKLREQLGLEIADLDAVGSRFFKEVYINPARVHPMAREHEVINEMGQ